MTMNKMCCVLCGHREEKVLFYKFPENPTKRRRWAEACGLEIKNIPKFGKLCQYHFLDEDFNSLNHQRKRLKTNVIPSQFLISPWFKASRVYGKAASSRSTKELIASPRELDASQEKLDTSLEILEILEERADTLQEYHQQEETQSLQQQNMSHELHTSREEPITPQKSNRCRHRIRYPGDIKTLEITTPERARKTIAFLKTEINKLRADKKKLQREVRKSHERIKNLDELITDLVESQLISEGFDEQFLVSC